MSIAATVIVPTTGDRGPLLPFSVGSVLRQGVANLEIFIMGDGVTDETREVVGELCRGDDRIRFFDHPKHVRRGETHRHAALQEARGEIVCYLCDRDLMLPHHVATMRNVLMNADFAMTWWLSMRPEGRLYSGPKVDLASSRQRRAILRGSGPIPLSMAAHTMEQYRRLPYGWRTTPPGISTDLYMWQQFLAQPGCRSVTHDELTIVYLNRTHGVGRVWSVEERRRELARKGRNVPLGKGRKWVITM